MAAVEESAARGKTLAQTVPRAATIVKAVAKIAVSYRIASAAKRRELHAPCAREFRELCEESGGAILKLGQFLSCRPDLLPAAYIEELLPLCHEAPSVSFGEIEQVLEQELSRPISECFREIEKTPLGTGSLAQVHRAVLADGRVVAVKVQLPGVDTLVEMDLAIIRAAGALLSDFMPEGSRGNVIEEFCRAVKGELDFADEARNAARFADLFREFDRVDVPAVVESLSTARVLVMEFCSGEPLARALPADPSERRSAYLALWLDSILYQVFEAGLVHGDPHPGNFLRTADDHLVMLDFGCVAELSDEVRRGYLETVTAVIQGDASRLSTALVALGFRSEDDAALADVATELLLGLRDPDRLVQMRANPQVVVDTVLAKVRAAGPVDVPDHFVLVARVLGSLAGQVVAFGQDVDVTGVTARALARAGRTFAATSKSM